MREETRKRHDFLREQKTRDGCLHNITKRRGLSRGNNVLCFCDIGPMLGVAVPVMVPGQCRKDMSQKELNQDRIDRKVK